MNRMITLHLTETEIIRALEAIDYCAESAEAADCLGDHTMEQAANWHRLSAALTSQWRKAERAKGGGA